MSDERPQADERPPREPPGFKLFLVLVLLLGTLAIAAAIVVRQMQFGVE